MSGDRFEFMRDVKRSARTMGNCLSKEVACEKCLEYKQKMQEYERRLEELKRRYQEALGDREKALDVLEKLHLEYVNSIAREM